MKCIGAKVQEVNILFQLGYAQIQHMLLQEKNFHTIYCKNPLFKIGFFYCLFLEKRWMVETCMYLPFVP